MSWFPALLASCDSCWLSLVAPWSLVVGCLVVGCWLFLCFGCCGYLGCFFFCFFGTVVVVPMLRPRLRPLVSEPVCYGSTHTLQPSLWRRSVPVELVDDSHKSTHQRPATINNVGRHRLRSTTQRRECGPGKGWKATTSTPSPR